MDREWNVSIYFKNGEQSEYVFQGGKEEARIDAYLSCAPGDIRRVKVTAVDEKLPDIPTSYSVG